MGCIIGCDKQFKLLDEEIKSVKEHNKLKDEEYFKQFKLLSERISYLENIDRLFIGYEKEDNRRYGPKTPIFININQNIEEQLYRYKNCDIFIKQLKYLKYKEINLEKIFDYYYHQKNRYNINDNNYYNITFHSDENEYYNYINYFDFVDYNINNKLKSFGGFNKSMKIKYNMIKNELNNYGIKLITGEYFDSNMNLVD